LREGQLHYVVLERPWRAVTRTDIPEKSRTHGFTLLHNFASLIEKNLDPV
jgi:hypothetical protein